MSYCACVHVCVYVFRPVNWDEEEIKAGNVQEKRLCNYSLCVELH